MDKKVLISVRTVQLVDGEPETVELVTEGKYYKKDSQYFAVYDETELSGMEGTTTTLKMEQDSLSIIRNGTTNSNLVFKKNYNHISMYNTPFGCLEVSVKPSKVEINVGEAGGNAQLEYKMQTAGLEPVSNSLELSIKEILN